MHNIRTVLHIIISTAMSDLTDFCNMPILCLQFPLHILRGLRKSLYGTYNAGLS